MIEESASRLRRLAPFSLGIRLLGPAFAVSIGYIDPGNWATDLAAGSYGFSLLWAIVAANVMAIVLQLAVARLTITTKDDLASSIASRWPKLSSLLWFVYQGAAMATDLAEFTGIVLGLSLLFHLSVALCVPIGVLVVLGILAMRNGPSKRFDYTLIAIIAAIALAYLYLVVAVHPAWSAVAHGAFVPAIPDSRALLVVIGIVGATVMPHNLFLHSSLVRDAVIRVGPGERCMPFFAWETFVALNIAALVNGAILIVGAALRGANGSIADAFDALRPIAGFAAPLFGASLLLCGIAASTTATLSGDVIFAAFSPRPLPASARRLATLLPTVLALLAGVNATLLLVWSQVALALVLPVVVVPLIVLMFREPTWRASNVGKSLVFATTGAAVVCVGMDVVVIAQSFGMTL